MRPWLPSVEYHTDVSDAARKLTYDLFDPDTGTCKKINESDVEARYYRSHSQAICGPAGAGKTLLHLAKAVSYARRRGKDRIIWLSGSIEPLAILSHNGELERAGAVVLADFDLQTVRGSLSSNDIKSLFDVRQGGAIESKRWHSIVFPVRLPRLFSLNGKVEDWLQIFEQIDDHNAAQMRRVCIAGYSQPLPKTIKFVNEEAKEKLEAIEIAEAQAELERERQW